MNDAYVLDDGVFRPIAGVTHREEEYDSAGFESLLEMQGRHFWYRGRHRFLNYALTGLLQKQKTALTGLRVIDLGGGCGGWIKYLLESGTQAGEMALGDSSRRALDFAAEVLPEGVCRYQIDLLSLDWQARWDVVFLLDVLEHIPQDELALREVHAAMAPGGLLMVTTPALQQLWSYNDELVHHVRRYSKSDFRRLAAECGFELLDARYFMFFLSPLLLLSRWCFRTDVKHVTPEMRNSLLERTHRVPNPVVNGLLEAVFAAETPLGHWVPFPWGTSIMGVFRKPTTAQPEAG